MQVQHHQQPGADDEKVTKRRGRQAGRDRRGRHQHEKDRNVTSRASCSVRTVELHQQQEDQQGVKTSSMPPAPSRSPRRARRRPAHGTAPATGKAQARRNDSCHHEPVTRAATTTRSADRAGRRGRGGDAIRHQQIDGGRERAGGQRVIRARPRLAGARGPPRRRDGGRRIVERQRGRSRCNCRGRGRVGRAAGPGQLDGGAGVEQVDGSEAASDIAASSRAALRVPSPTRTIRVFDAVSASSSRTMSARAVACYASG